MIRNWYSQIPHPALKTKREITKYINWRQFTKGTRGKQNEQLFPQIGDHLAKSIHQQDGAEIKFLLHHQPTSCFM